MHGCVQNDFSLSYININGLFDCIFINDYRKRIIRVGGFTALHKRDAPRCEKFAASLVDVTSKRLMTQQNVIAGVRLGVGPVDMTLWLIVVRTFMEIDRHGSGISKFVG